MSDLRVWVLLAAVVSSLADHSDLEFPVAMMAEIIADLQQHKFHSGCLFLVEHKNRAESFQVQKLLSERAVSAATMNFPTLIAITEAIRCRQNRPLYVIVSNDRATQRYLQAVTRRRGVAYPRWLLFLESKDRPEEFLRGVNIPFDCEFMVARRRGDRATLVEVYQVHGLSPLYVNHFGDWSPDRGLYNNIHIFYKRRNNLHGHVLKMTAIHDPRMMTVVDTGRGEVKFGGYFGSVWNVLQRRMNFTTRYVRPRDRVGGYLMPNGSWNGMINMVIQREVDVALRPFTLTSSRVAAVDFPLPIIFTKSYVFLREPERRDRGIQAFFAPFSRRLWMAVVGAMLLLALHLTAFHRVGRWAGNAERMGPRGFCLYESLLLIHGIFCQQGYDNPPRSASCRIVYVEAYLVAVLICAAYSATIVSFLAIQKVSLPFNTFEGLLKDGTYAMEVKDDSGLLENVATSNDSTLRALFNKMDVDRLPSSVEEGLIRVCREDNYAFMASMAVSQSVDDSLPCTIVALTQAYLPESSAIAFTKGSPYRGIVHNNLLELRRAGVLSRLLLAAWPKDRAQEYSLSHVSWRDVKALLIMLAVSGVAAILILTIECAVSRVRPRRKRRRRVRYHD